MKRMVVVGGGPVGACCALLAAELLPELEVQVLEAGESPAAITGPDLRVFAISPAGRSVLQRVGAWSAIPADRRLDYPRMHVWEEDASLSFDAAEIGEPDLGTMVGHAELQRSLHGVLSRHPRIRVRYHTLPDEVRSQPDAVRLRLGDELVTADLVVAADGARSTTRSAAGIETSVRAYGQHAVVCSLRPELPHEDTAWQRFLPDGTLALLPMADGCVSLVWSTADQAAQRLMALDDTELGSAIRRASENRLGQLQVTGPRASFPLLAQEAERYFQDRIVLVGDAAHSVHPLAGQGLNLGLMDVAVLCEELMRARARGEDVGSSRALIRYQRRRRAEVRMMARGLDGLQRLFTDRRGSVGVLRRMGLGLVDRISPLRDRFMRHAMGLGGDVPRSIVG